jgi:uncharacterized PurR-regulated membrane protein YhhQ (DUF165 family)
MLGFALSVSSFVFVPPHFCRPGPDSELAWLRWIVLTKGAAFLLSQLMDIVVFSCLWRQACWYAPTDLSVTGPMLDPAVFLSLALAPAVLAPGLNHGFALVAAPLHAMCNSYVRH